jgi:hypothetical protein
MIDDDFVTTPPISYGTQKVIGELLLSPLIHCFIAGFRPAPIAPSVIPLSALVELVRQHQDGADKDERRVRQDR